MSRYIYIYRSMLDKSPPGTVPVYFVTLWTHKENIFCTQGVTLTLI